MDNQQETNANYISMLLGSSETTREAPLKIQLKDEDIVHYTYESMYFCIDLSFTFQVGNLNKRLESSLSTSSFDNSSNKYNYNYNYLGSYLAGLIEGDGSIIVPKTIRNQKGKLLYPVVKITFVKKDAPLAQKIKEVIKGGQIVYSNNSGYLDLLFQDLKSIQKG